MAIATKQEILDYLETIEIQELLDRMEHYVQGRFYNKSEKIRKGVDYLDFCYNVLIKACDGTRNWDRDKTTFELFVFGSLKSDLHNFFRKLKKESNSDSNDPSDTESYIIELNECFDIDELKGETEAPNIDFEDIYKDSISSLKEQGADDLELAVFECWLNGYFKPQEIAELNNVSTFEVNNTVKRLSRKRINLQQKWKSLKN